MGYKRKRFANQPDWFNLDPDLLDLVLKKFKFVDKFRFLAICKQWYSVAKPHISSLIQIAKSQPPLLMSRANQNNEDSNSQSFFNLKNNQWRKITDLPTKYDQCKCLGSSNGWLVFLDQGKNNHYLFNPLLEAEIKFDNLAALPGTTKVVLLSDPICDNNIDENHNYAIVAIHKIALTSIISYVMCGDERWINFEFNSKTSYLDIVSNKHLLYALSETCSVEAWDFRNTTSGPVKVLEYSLGFPQDSIEPKYRDGELYYSGFYLIVSKGEFLLVIRYIGYNVRDDGLVVYEANMIENENQCYGFQYLTKFFYVFKLDSNKEEWIRVESLGDGVIFLGANRSVLLQAEDCKEYKKNSIYFTDDSLDLIDWNEDSGGHDTGIFTLEDHSIKWFFESTCMKPPPFWVIPG